MKFPAVLVLLLGLTVSSVVFEGVEARASVKTGSSSTQSCSCGQRHLPVTLRSADRIVGGVDAQVNEFPLVGGLIYDSNPAAIFCGGTIITKRHVLTAAHCKKPFMPSVSVIFAEHNTESTTDSATVTISVQDFIIHEKFNEKGATDNDVALLLMAKEIPFGPTIGPACFPGPGLTMLDKQVRIIGWGVLYDDGPQPDVLQKVDVSVVPTAQCSAVYNAVNNGSLCTYTLNKDACQGDSGGPIIYMNTRTRSYTVVGIVSRGIGCAEEGTPAVNTNVSFFRDWILKKVAETDPTATVCPGIQSE